MLKRLIVVVMVILLIPGVFSLETDCDDGFNNDEGSLTIGAQLCEMDKCKIGLFSSGVWKLLELPAVFLYVYDVHILSPDEIYAFGVLVDSTSALYYYDGDDWVSIEVPGDLPLTEPAVFTYDDFYLGQQNGNFYGAFISSEGRFIGKLLWGSWSQIANPPIENLQYFGHVGGGMIEANGMNAQTRVRYVLDSNEQWVEVPENGDVSDYLVILLPSGEFVVADHIFVENRILVKKHLGNFWGSVVSIPVSSTSIVDVSLWGQSLSDLYINVPTYGSSGSSLYHWTGSLNQVLNNPGHVKPITLNYPQEEWFIAEDENYMQKIMHYDGTGFKSYRIPHEIPSYSLISSFEDNYIDCGDSDCEGSLACGNKGDLLNDGKINLDDFNSQVDYFLNTGYVPEIADVDCTSGFDVNDLLAMVDRLIGKEEQFPVCSS